MDFQLKLVLFEPKGLFRKFPDTNTIFGAICWGIRTLYGEKKLLDFLEEYKEGHPPVVWSSPLPVKERENNQIELFFPKPPLKGSPLDVKSAEELIKTYPIHKEYKKISHLDWNTFLKILKGEIKEERELFEEVQKVGGNLLKDSKAEEKEKLKRYKEEIPSIGRSELLVRTAIDRLTFHAAEGQLHNEVVFTASQFGVLFLVKNGDWWEIIKRTLKLVRFAGNKTTGMGVFKYTVYGEKELSQLKELKPFLSPKGRTKVITLAPTFYEENIDIESSLYTPSVSRSAVDKFWGYFDERFIKLPLWKKVSLYLHTGSFLKLKEPKETLGGIKEALKYKGEDSLTIYQYGYGFPLFVGSPAEV